MAGIRTALVGCGKVGRIHAAALARLPLSQFVAVCDHSLARAQAFAQEFGVQAFDQLPEMLRAARVEALMVATPHPLHPEAAVAAAQAGVHVLVEKPLAPKVADCDRMLAAARAAGTRLGVISQRRLYEPVQRMKQAIDAGKIGRPVLGVVSMFSWRDEAYYASDPWRGKWATEGGGVLVNQAPHQLDILQWLMGDLEEVSGYWGNLNHPYIEVEDTAVAVLRFRGGGLGTITASLSQKPGLFTKVHIHGSNGASVGVETDRGATFVAGMSEICEPPLNDLWTIPGEEGLLSDFQGADRRLFAAIKATEHYHALQIADFLEAIRNNRPPLATGEDGRAVVALFEAIYESQRTGRPVRMAP
jgi:predicted dehydrogenase